MKAIKFRKTAIAIAFAGISLTTYSQAQSPSTWLKPTAPLEFEYAYQGSPADLRFFINGNDVSDLVERVSPDHWRYNSQLFALPSGDVSLTIYSAETDSWQELSTLNFQVLTRSGFERAEYGINTSLNIDAQLDAGAKDDGFAPEEKQRVDASGYIGVHSTHARSDLEIQSNLNLAAASKHENALRYGEKFDNAPLVDLSDYLVSVRKGKLSVQVGHVNFGNNPLLVSGMANRGLNTRYQINSRFDFGVSAQNGSAIAGWENFLGLQNSDHQVVATQLGIELRPSAPGSQRIELSYLDGKTQSISDFGIGEITDAEKNQGWGIRYQSHMWQSRIRLDSAYAQSRYLNIQDALLAQGDELVEVTPSTDTAWHVDLGIDVIQANYEQPLKNFATTLQYRKERADAFYRSIAAFVSADTITETISVAGNLQHAQWQWSHVKSEDNVDDIPTILKTGTHSSTVSLNFNIADWLRGNDYNAEPSTALKLWPVTSLNFQRVNQRALNNPDSLFSDFNGGSHLPDQQNDVADLGLSWGIGQGSIGLSYNWSEQDNRQVGRENADFERSGWSVSSNYPLFNALNISVGFGKAKNIDIEQNIEQLNKHGNILVQWQLPKNFTFEGGFSKNEDYTNLGTSNADATTSNIGLSQQLYWANLRVPISGQWFIRYSNQKNSFEDSIFDFQSRAETWVTTAGLSLSF